MSKNSDYSKEGCYAPEYEGYCKKCKKKTKFIFDNYVKEEYVSYSCSVCHSIVKENLKDGEYVHT